MNTLALWNREMEALRRRKRREALIDLGIWLGNCAGFGLFAASCVILSTAGHL